MDGSVWSIEYSDEELSSVGESAMNASRLAKGSESSAPPPVRLFCSYSRKDEAFLKELRAHLAALEQENVIVRWDDGEILPGSTWKPDVDKHLEEAEIVLLLVSADFVASQPCQEERKMALQRQEQDLAEVIPVILRDCAWRNLDGLGTLQVLPKDGMAITDPEWKSRDKAWLSVVEGLQKIVAKRRGELPNKGQDPARSLVSSQQAFATPQKEPAPAKANVKTSNGSGRSLLLALAMALLGLAAWQWLSEQTQSDPGPAVPPVNTSYPPTGLPATSGPPHGYTHYPSSAPPQSYPVIHSSPPTHYQSPIGGPVPTGSPRPYPGHTATPYPSHR